MKTFKNNGGDVTGAKLYYRVYKELSAPGAFIEVNLPYDSELGGGDQKWDETASNINILALATSNGTWVIELYWKATSNEGDRFDNNGGSNYNRTFSVTTLPIELTSFTAKKQENTTQLNWTTSTEENNDFFTIEKSLDGINFEAIGTKAGAGNSLEVREYNFTDAKPANGKNYYRLKQTDF
ncbi:MAG: hypothetical protein HC803_08785 [Saprospiraceae bacterium]|nr:hypothetical protein [Saprospiraceae bacterium]